MHSEPASFLAPVQLEFDFTRPYPSHNTEPEKLDACGKNSTPR